jgi:hypothetical protein
VDKFQKAVNHDGSLFFGSFLILRAYPTSQLIGRKSAQICFSVYDRFLPATIVSFGSKAVLSEGNNANRGCLLSVIN